MKEQIEKLQSLLPALKAGDASFATSLIASYKKYGLSAKQEPWIAKLIARAEGAEKKPEKATISLGDFAGVIKLFKTAQQHLTFPKIVLECAGKKVILSVAGAKSQNPGTVGISGEGQYPNREWFGRVTAEGVWEPSYKTDPTMQEALKTLLVELAKNPAGVAKLHGQLTGRCCFCNAKLTDKRSVTAGFGPICAEHYGLTAEWNSAAGGAETSGIYQTPAPTDDNLIAVQLEFINGSLPPVPEEDLTPPWVIEETPLYAVWQ